MAHVTLSFLSIFGSGGKILHEKHYPRENKNNEFVFLLGSFNGLVRKRSAPRLAISTVSLYSLDRDSIIVPLLMALDLVLTFCVLTGLKYSFPTPRKKKVKVEKWTSTNNGLCLIFCGCGSELYLKLPD